MHRSDYLFSLFKAVSLLEPLGLCECFHSSIPQSGVHMQFSCNADVLREEGSCGHVDLESKWSMSVLQN